MSPLSQTPHPQAESAEVSPDNISFTERDEDEGDDEAEPVAASPGGNDGDGGGETYTPKKTFIAIDGIHPNDLETPDREALEKEIIDFLLVKGYPIEDVRVASDDHAIVEVQVNE